MVNRRGWLCRLAGSAAGLTFGLPVGAAVKVTARVTAEVTMIVTTDVATDVTTGVTTDVTARPMADPAAGGAAPPPQAEGAVCNGLPPPALQAVTEAVWWVPAHEGDANAANRGQVAHGLAVRDGSRLWLIGTGPSPAFGQALGCALRAVAGMTVTDLIDPWAHPEDVLGNPAFPAARRWAHEGVAQAMQRQCRQCVSRLQERLGAAAGDLGPDPVLLPDRLLQGDHGRLGPFDWWRWHRSSSMPVTAWWHAGARVLMAPGLVWVDAPPDLRDADVADAHRAVDALQAVAQRLAAGGALAVVGEQGPMGNVQSVVATAVYVGALRRAVEAAQERGAAETDHAPPLDGVPAHWVAHPRHALNWQRAWRQAEAQSLSGARGR